MLYYLVTYTYICVCSQVKHGLQFSWDLSHDRWSYPCNGNLITWKDRLYTANIMMTSSNGNIFRVTGPLCGEFTGPGEVPTQKPVTPSFDVFFDLRLNKRLSKQPWGWWFETLSWSLWRQCNGFSKTRPSLVQIMVWRLISTKPLSQPMPEYCSFIL